MVALLGAGAFGLVDCRFVHDRLGIVRDRRGTRDLAGVPRHSMDRSAPCGLDFFAGSMFFTSAAYLQWLEAINNDVTNSNQKAGEKPHGWRFFGTFAGAICFLVGAYLLIPELFETQPEPSNAGTPA